MAGILIVPHFKGKNIAIVTHAGGPAVMLTDVLSKNGLNIPKIEGKKANALLKQLYEGSSVANPIDFLATGNAEQLDIILNYCETEFNIIDAIVVIFGSPGLTSVFDIYKVLDSHIKKAVKPIYPILPSVINVDQEIKDFIKKGHTVFTDEVLFGKALAKIHNTPKPSNSIFKRKIIDIEAIKKIISNTKNTYLDTKSVKLILESAGITTNKEWVVYSKNELLKAIDII